MKVEAKRDRDKAEEPNGWAETQPAQLTTSSVGTYIMPARRQWLTERLLQNYPLLLCKRGQKLFITFDRQYAWRD